MKQTRIKYQNRMRRNRTNRLKSCTGASTGVSTGAKPNKETIIENFIEMLNTIKLYHWNTHSFSQHKATDELHERLSKNVDKFVEVLLGKRDSRIKHIQPKIPIVNNRTSKSFKHQIYQYREYLIGMNRCLDPKRDTDLLNIRDEILGDINQLLYLLSLK